jgi:hypothetical protein
VVLGRPHQEAVFKGPNGLLAIFQRVASKTLPVRDAEVHPGGRPLLTVALARRHRKAVLEGSDGPLLVIRTAAGDAISVGNAEMHVCLGPLFRIVLPRQARERIFERGDRQFPVLRPVAFNALRVSKAEVHLSIGALLGFLERFFPTSRSFTIAVRLEQLRELSKGATQFREHLLSDILLDSARCRQNGTAGRGSPGGRIGSSWPVGS